MSDRAVHVTITGFVQGVGYRAWVEREAQTRGLSGWVRNRRDGSVEAVFSADAAIVEAMLAACRSGPSVAQVDGVAVTESHEPVGRGFQVLPTA